MMNLCHFGQNLANGSEIDCRQGFLIEMYELGDLES